MPTKNKKISAVIRIQQGGGVANVAKLGQVLGSYSVNIVGVMKEFNELSAPHKGLLVSADITIFEDRSFEVAIKSPTTSSLLLREVGTDKGSGLPHTHSVGRVTTEQVRKIAEIKLSDLNALTVEQAMKVVVGAARSMGIQVVD
jgi:large subunit ribosomal protein L11